MKFDEGQLENKLQRNKIKEEERTLNCEEKKNSLSQLQTRRRQFFCFLFTRHKHKGGGGWHLETKDLAFLEGMHTARCLILRRDCSRFSRIFIMTWHDSTQSICWGQLSVTTILRFGSISIKLTVISIFLHLSIIYLLFIVGLWRQQAQQKDPDLPLHSNTHQLLLV